MANSLNQGMSGCHSNSGQMETKKSLYNFESPKIVRHPLQEVTNPVVSSPLVHTSLTPYRYHKCKVIPEEIENQENINPQNICQPSASPGHKSGTSNEPAHTDKSLSPFAYPQIFEGYYSSSSSSSSSYKSPINKPYFPSNSNCHFFESPKTSVTTPRGKVSVLGSSGDSDKGLEHQGRLRVRRPSNSVKTLARGLDNGNQPNFFTSSLKNVTPNKSVCTPSSSEKSSVFRTPSESCGSDSRVVTPQQRYKKFQVFNPFESGIDHLHLPTVSPSLFSNVVSPTENVYQNFQWSIDEIALLKPVNIEMSPCHQTDLTVDSDYEHRAQAAIDKYFSMQSVVPSPWTGNNKPVNLPDFVIEKVTSCHSTPTTRTISSQTELTLPAVLPKALEEALKPFCTYTQDQSWQPSNDSEEGSNLNNTALRRKLLFGSEDLANATPMCSPRGPASPESNTSSPAAPLPLHDDDDHIDECEVDISKDEATESLWCTDVICPSFSSSLDPSQSRFTPPTPPFPNDHLTSHIATSESGPLGNYSGFHSPTTPVQVHSPNVSPIGNNLHATASCHVPFSSPDVSPIQNSKENIILRSGHSSHTKFTCVASELRTSGSFIDHAHDLSGMQMSQEIEQSDSEEISSKRLNEELAMAEKEERVTRNTESSTRPEEEKENSCSASHGNLSPDIVRFSPTSECGPQRTPSSKTEKRSSGNSGQFSSSPIRDVRVSPLAVDTSCKFSSSPPLSPILCRSILVQKTTGQFSQERQFKDVAQSTLINVGLEARCNSEEEIMMDEGIVSGGLTNPNSPLSGTKQFTDTQELSSLCDMDTDLQQSIEMSHDVKSQESGYQTGSLQSTNFSISTFAGNSTLCSSQSFQKERHPSIFGNESTGHQPKSGTLAEKKLPPNRYIVD